MRAVRALVAGGMVLSVWIGWRAAIVTAELASGLNPLPAVAPPAFATYSAPLPPAGRDDGFDWRDPQPPPAMAAAAAPPPQVHYVQVPVYLPRSEPRARPEREWEEPRGPSGRLAFLGNADQFPPPVTAAPPPSAPATASATPPDMLEQGWREASDGYARLAAGDRRGAAESLKLALSVAPDHPNAREWRREVRRLTKSWRVEIATLQRPVADGQLPAASQVLGSTVTTTFLGWSPNPAARRPVELFARAIVADRQTTLDGVAGAQAAVGAQWRPLADVPFTIAAERLIAVQYPSRDDFSVRAFGGAAKAWNGFQFDSFVEAGVIGDRLDWFLGGQAAAVKPVRLPGNFTAALGGGVWGSVQKAGLSLSRVDVGPTLRLRRTNFPLYLNADYRFRIQGNALPGDGPAVTVVTNF